MIELAPQRDFIAGTWREPTIQRGESIEHASTGLATQAQLVSNPAAIEVALQAAWALHQNGEWSRQSTDSRAAILDAMADFLEPRIGAIAAAESATTGVIIGTTSMLGFIVHGAFRLAAMQLRSGVLSTRFDGPAGSEVEVERWPWGPALLLCPWNAPAPMAAHKMASALAAGCPVIIKPPERAPHGSAWLAVAADELGLAPGLVQLLHGGPEVAAALMNDDRVRAVSFTGGIVGGRAVAHACAEGLKPAQLELGGHSPLVIMPDAPLEYAVQATVALLTTLNGQWCRALGRLLVPTERHDEILDAVTSALAAVTIGDPLNPSAEMGPIGHSAHLAHLRSRIDALVGLGGTQHASTPLPDAPGSWLAPTLISGVDPTHTLEEIFGPVASIHGYSTVEEALALANGTRYGLEAYVVGHDVDAAMTLARRVRAGGVKVNGASPISLNLMAPRAAFGVSGLHDEGTTETIHFFGGSHVAGVENSLGTTH